MPFALASPESAGMSKARLERTDRHLRERYIETGRFPGTQLMVYRRGQLVHKSSLGLADLERKVAVNDDTIIIPYTTAQKKLIGITWLDDILKSR